MLKDILTLLCSFFVLLVTTGSLASNQVASPQNRFEKFEKEVMNLVKGFTDFINGAESSPTNQTSIYSTEEYGPFAAPLNKYKQMLELSKQEARDAAQAIKEVDLGNIFTDDVFFDFLKTIDKKKKLERLSIFLDESEKRAENVQSEYKAWILSSPDLDEVSREFLLESHYMNAEKNEFIRKESYKIKKNLTDEFTKLFDFLSKIFGTYEKGENSQIICSNDHDTSILNAHFAAIQNLVKEESNLALLSQQHIMEMEKSFVAATKMDPIPAHVIEEYVQGQSLLICLEKFMEFCKQENINIDRALDEADVNSICTEEVLFNLVKINDRKKKLEQLHFTLDESEKRWDKHMPDLIERLLSSRIINDQMHKRIEAFSKSVPILIKQSLAIKKEYALEFINLLNLLSMRHGTYKLIDNDQNLLFSSEMESKIYESYIKNINKLFKEEQNVDLLIEQLLKDLRLDQEG